MEEKVDFLIKNKDNLTVEIPSNVKYITSIVVTSFPEYIWDTSEALFLGEDVSRIMIPSEISHLKRNDILKNLHTKDFVKEI